MHLQRHKPALGAFLLAVVAALLTFSPAYAAVPGQPSGLTPDGGVSPAGSPTLTWNRVSGATSYEVKVATDDSFSSATTKYSATTVNRRVVPTVQLPVGVLYWEVRAKNSSGTSDWSIGTFDHTAAAGPALVSPGDGDGLHQPENPVLLTWAPVAGATSYSVEIGTDDQFNTLSKTYSPVTTSVLVDAPGLANTYFWRVRAVLGAGIYSDYSETRSYNTTGMDVPERVSPANDGDAAIQDVVLDWLPVTGAKQYNLQISTDANFNTFALTQPGIVGTRYSPPTTLDNDQYYWRIQPVNAAGQTLDWSTVDIWTFRRNWPDQPTLENPGTEYDPQLDPPVVHDPLFFQWTPAQKASRYQLQIATDPGFDDSVMFDKCNTQSTTYVPTGKDDCFPTAAGTYYWRVLALDDPRTPAVQSEVIFSEIYAFSYDPDRVDLASTSPANNANVAIPTLRWNPVRGAASYRVYIYKSNGTTNVVNGASTYATAYTPRSVLTVGETYKWYVRPVSASGRLGAALTPADMRSFTVIAQADPTATNPEPTSPATSSEFKRFPTLSWTPVVGATRYKIGIRRTDGIASFTDLADYFAYPEGQDDGIDYLATAEYEWRVTAYDGSTPLTSSTQTRTFKIVDFEPTSTPRVAMTGLGSASNATSCTAALAVDGRCERTRHTPVLRWAPVSDAGFYRVQLWYDANRTNSVEPAVYVDQSLYMRTSELPDSQAADAYYWTVEACRGTKSSPRCRSTVQSPARWAFNKLSNPSEGLSPGAQVDPSGTPVAGASPVPTIADEINFSWKDYKQTNFDDPRSASGDDPGELDSVGQKSRLEARSYLVEVSTVPNFASKLETRDVDQTTFTAFAKAYPEGFLYWRVRAIDADGNALSPSPAYKVFKSSPAPTLTAMPNGRHVTGSEPFRWLPLDYAAGYDIEVYRNDDIKAQPANKVFSTSSTQAALVRSTSPLPVSSSAYRWRVRKYDASGNRAAWSDLDTDAARFWVVGTSPSLISPSGNAYVRPTDGLFSWQAVTGATKYRFERRKAGTTSLTESVSTPALAWAPTKALSEGSWYWRVVALDAAGAQLGASAWRAFMVDTTAPTVIAKSPTGTVASTTNFTVKFSERVTKVSTSTYRLYIAGNSTPRTATVTLSSTGTSAVLNPSSNLTKGKTYYVRLSSGITDSAGNKLVATSWKVVAK